ncbi:MAG: DUF3109 family protein [Bacteroidota bacterium]
MIQVDNTLLSEDLFSERFLCDLTACKGACCIEGDSGAPLEPEEVGILEDALEAVKPYMRREGIDRVEEVGVFTVDIDGEYVTPLVNGEECAFVSFDKNGTAKCAIEQAHRDGKIDFKKPISCHLYPIRLSKINDLIALNYHSWPICDPARACGAKLDLKVFRFLKEPLVRRFGEEYFYQLLEVERLLEESSD